MSIKKPGDFWKPSAKIIWVPLALAAAGPADAAPLYSYTSLHAHAFDPAYVPALTAQGQGVGQIDAALGHSFVRDPGGSYSGPERRGGGLGFVSEPGPAVGAYRNYPRPHYLLRHSAATAPGGHPVGRDGKGAAGRGPAAPERAGGGPRPGGPAGRGPAPAGRCPPPRRPPAADHGGGVAPPRGSVVEDPGPRRDR